MADTTSTHSGSDDVDFILPDEQKLEALAEFAAGAGHEINNPLATIIGRAQLLLKDESDPQRRQMLTSIGAQAYRIRDMIGDTMLFGRPPRPEFEDVNLSEIVHRVVAKLHEDLAIANCSVETRIESSIIVLADSTQLAVVLNELLRNARQALLPTGGSISILASVHKKIVQINVVDHGKGFSELERQHAFDPFFSGRQAGRGLGFGLSKCWRIIRQNGGQIKIRSSDDGPTTISVELRLANID